MAAVYEPASNLSAMVHVVPFAFVVQPADDGVSAELIGMDDLPISGLARVDPDDVWLNTDDAAARGISNGQRVRIFNNLGATILPAFVTDRIAHGVVSIKEGAWFTPDATGTDTNGCANALSVDRSAPCGATTYNTNYVQVAPATRALTDAIA